MFHQFKLTFVLVLYMRLCLESHALTDICNVCICSSSNKNIDCQSKGLASLLLLIPTNVLLLGLEKNLIKEIKDRTFENISSLETLHLENNDISEIEAGSFDKLSSLTKLDLSYNEYMEIKAGTFHNLTSLTHLNLQSNKLKEIKADTFKDLTRLQILSVQNNSIAKIENTSFDDLTKLKNLYLDGNDMKEVKADIFQYFVILRTLSLADNDMEKIKGEMFDGISDLETLYLNGNNIEKIQGGTFSALPMLESLYLNGNNIGKLQAGTFENMNNLKHLDLSNNRIQDYEDGAFLFLSSIESIDLRNNTGMKCGCHLPAFVNYTNSKYSRTVKVEGECQTDSDNGQSKVIPIMEYSQCQDYSLFQRNLQCQNCSGMMCNDSEVANCPGDESLCQIKFSMGMVKLTIEKSCSTYSKCINATKSNALPCNQLTRGSSCVACCTENLCNKNDFIGWSNTFVFPLTLKSTSKSSEGNVLAKNISRAMEHELSKLLGIFEAQYCGFEMNREIFSITSTVLSGVTKDQVFKQIFEALNTSKSLRDLGLEQENIELFHGGLCMASTTTRNGTLYWPVTKIGTNLTIPCQANVATRYCSSRQEKHLEMRNCSLFTGIWQEPDMSQCYNTEWITQQLKNITSEKIDEGNAEEISIILRDVTKRAAYFKAEDVGLVVGIQEKMLPLISNMSANVTVNNILPSIDDLINSPEEILEQSGETRKRIRNLVETISEKIPLEEQKLTALYSNLGIGAIKVEKDTFTGASYGISFGNKENTSKTMIDYNINSDPQASDEMGLISLPNGLLKYLKIEEKSNVSRVSFFSMKNDNLYKVKQNSSTKASSTINSIIIAASVPGTPIKDLDEPIRVAFNLMDQNAGNPQCVYWEESPGQGPHWSNKGCKTSEYVAGEKIICSCNHLTSFAVLNVPVKESKSHLLHLTSHIGCGISLACIILTVMIHVCCKNLRKLTSSRILINLCISLAITNIIFLAGMHSYALEGIAGCKTVAALLHYFLLTSLMWIAVEALHLSHTMESFMVKSSILAWGLPAVIVSYTLGVNKTDNCIRISEICWLSETPFYAGFLAPVVVILLFIMFFLLVWKLREVKSDNVSEDETQKMRVFGIFGLVSLFVLSWIIAFVAVEEEEDEVYQILFIVFNILLGMFILIFYCFCKKDTREAVCTRAS